MVAPLPQRRRPPRRSKTRWPEEAVYLATVAVGLILLGLSFHTFHKKRAQRSDALQQLRASRQAAGGATAAASGSSVGLHLRGRSWGATAGGSDAAAEVDSKPGALDLQGLHAASKQQQEQHPAEHGSSGDGSSRRRGDEAAHLAAGSGAGGGSQRQLGEQEADTELQHYCEEHFGLEWLRRWGTTARQVCSASRQLAAGGGLGRGGSSGGGGAGSGGDGDVGLRDGSEAPSVVTCRAWNDSHMPAASAPHVLCDATNLRLDPSKLQRSLCPRHRPGYLCITRTYHRYGSGAWAVDCSWPGFRLDEFSKDHQQDIFGSMLFRPADGASAVPAIIEALPTLLVTRETKEHINVYHTLTDLLNVYVTLRTLGWEDRPRQVVILDAHTPGPLDILWPVVAAGGGTEALAAARKAQQQGGHPWDVRVAAGSGEDGLEGGGGGGEGGGGFRPLVRRVSEYKAPVLFRHAAFVPPGYTSLLFADLYQNASCPLPTRLFSDFRAFVLGAFGLGSAAGGTAAGGEAEAAGGGRAGAADRAGAAEAARGGAGGIDAESSSSGSEADGSDHSQGGGAPAVDAFVIRLVSRRPTKRKRSMPRQIANEEELLQALRALDGTVSSAGVGSGGSSSGGSSSEGRGAQGGETEARGAAAPLLAVSVSLLDFANMTVEQQLATVQQTDVLIGMHGAALAHALLVPPHAALVELWPQADGMWRCYQNFAQWAGALYRRVANADPSRHRDTPRGDITEVDAAELQRTVRELLPLVAARRRSERRRAGGGAGGERGGEEAHEL